MEYLSTMGMKRLGPIVPVNRTRKEGNVALHLSEIIPKQNYFKIESLMFDSMPKNINLSDW